MFIVEASGVEMCIGKLQCLASVDLIKIELLYSVFLKAKPFTYTAKC